MRYNHSINYSDLKIFGCFAYVHVNNSKLEMRARKYIFLVYKNGVKRYRLWNTNESKSFKNYY